MHLYIDGPVSLMSVSWKANITEKVASGQHAASGDHLVG